MHILRLFFYFESLAIYYNDPAIQLIIMIKPVQRLFNYLRGSLTHN